MSTWETIAATPFVQRLGWTLLHSVWQAAAVALLLAVALRAIPARRSDVRYGACCLALLAVCLWFALTLCVVQPVGQGDLSPAVDLAGGVKPASTAAEAEVAMRDGAGPWPAVEGPTPAPGANDGTSDGGRRGDQATRRAPELALVWNGARWSAMLQAAMPWLVAVWLLGACGVGVWHLGGFVAVRGLRRRASPPAESVLALARDCAQRLGLRRAVRILCSATVSSPAVVALVPPTILLPAALLTGLTPAELQALLLHELAHIRRHDGWVNLLQAVVESLLFYHPAVWWISRTVRAERENCCDDVASAALGNRFDYARALTAVFSDATGTPAAGCAAVAGTGGSLVQRIERLLLPAPPRDLAAFRALAGLLVLAGALLAAAFAGYGSARSAQADDPSVEAKKAAPAGESGRTKSSPNLPTAIPTPQNAAVPATADDLAMELVRLVVAELTNEQDEHRRMVQTAESGNHKASAQLAKAREGLRAAQAAYQSLLAKGLSDNEPAVRAWAARTIGDLGENGAFAERALAQAQNDADAMVREAAVKAWKQIPHNSPAATPQPTAAPKSAESASQEPRDPVAALRQEVMQLRDRLRALQQARGRSFAETVAAVDKTHDAIRLNRKIPEQAIGDNDVTIRLWMLHTLDELGTAKE